MAFTGYSTWRSGKATARVRAGNAVAKFRAVRQLALSLLKQRTEAKVGIKNRLLRAA
jgi:hypothetical protein